MITTKNDFKVELLNKDEVKDFFARWGQFSCTCYNTPKKYAKRVGEVCFESEHNSGSRAFHFIFDISEVPRSLVDQLVRHENGVVKNVQSFRYVAKEGATVFIPHLIDLYPEIREEYELAIKDMNKHYSNILNMLKEKGYKGEKANEQARGILAMNTNTSLTIGFTYEALKHLANERLCTRAEYPIRQLVKMMVKEVVEVLPQLEPVLVAKCIDRMYCTEDKSCGLRMTKEDLIWALDRMNETYKIEHTKKVEE